MALEYTSQFLPPEVEEMYMPAPHEAFPYPVALPVVLLNLSPVVCRFHLTEYLSLPVSFSSHSIPFPRDAQNIVSSKFSISPKVVCFIVDFSINILSLFVYFLSFPCKTNSKSGFMLPP